MADDDLVGELVVEPPGPSLWAVAALVAACVFTCGALVLLILGWT